MGCFRTRLSLALCDMSKAHSSQVAPPERPVDDEEDEETLAAIDRGIADAKAGRTVPAEEVRKLVPKWTTATPTRKKR